MRVILSLMLLLLLPEAKSAVDIGKIDFNATETNAKVNVHFSGNMQDYPEISFNKNVMYLNFPKSRLKMTYTKKVVLQERKVIFRSKQHLFKIKILK